MSGMDMGREDSVPVGPGQTQNARNGAASNARFPLVGEIDKIPE